MTTVRLSGLVCILALAVISTPVLHSVERASLSWEWSAPELKRITSSASRLTKDETGYWEHKSRNLSARTNVSAELAIAGFHYLETAAGTFGKVSGLAFSKTTYGQLRLVIHDKPDTFTAANPTATGVRCTHKVVASDSDKTDIEFHVVAGVERNAVNFAAAIPLAELQYEIGLAFTQLCTGKTTPPTFLARGLAEFFAGWDMRVDSYTAATTTSALYGEKDQTLRLMLKGPACMPTLASLVALTPADFTGADQDRNTALVLGFMDFMVGPHGKRRSNLSKLCTALEKDGVGHDYTQTLLEVTSLKKLQQDWRLHLCRVAGRSLMPEQFQFEVEGGLSQPIAIRDQGGNYGYRPSALITPMPNGAYTIAWYDPNGQTIRLLACDTQNRKTRAVNPDFLVGARSLLGCAHTGKNNTYVIAYSKDHAAGGKNSSFYLCGITADGRKIFDQLVFGDKPLNEIGSKSDPGGAGTGRVIYNDATGVVGFYLAHHQRQPDGITHQGGYIGSLQPDGKKITCANGWFVSHNFDQRLISSGSAFYALAHGDAYPRALSVSRWNIAGGSLSKQFDVPYHNIPGAVGDNRTNCLTGGLVELNGGKHVAIVYSTSNGRKTQDVGISLIDANGELVTSRWLTQYQEGTLANFPRIARSAQGVLVVWAEHTGSTAPRLRMLLMSPDLKQAFVDKTYAELELPASYDLVNLSDGSITWVIPKNGKLLVNRIDLSDKVQGDLYGLLKMRAGFED